jgi:hypothetical protein
MISNPRGPYTPEAVDDIAGPKAGVALTPVPYFILFNSDGSDVAHVDAPESNII